MLPSAPPFHGLLTCLSKSFLVAGATHVRESAHSRIITSRAKEDRLYLWLRAVCHATLKIGWKQSNKFRKHYMFSNIEVMLSQAGPNHQCCPGTWCPSKVSLTFSTLCPKRRYLSALTLSPFPEQWRSNLAVDVLNKSALLLLWKSVINKLSDVCTDRFFVKASLRKPRCQAEQVFNEKCQAKHAVLLQERRRGAGAWLEALNGSIVKREHICVQDLLWLLPHIIGEMKQRQHRCAAVACGSRFDTFCESPCRFIAWEPRKDPTELY